MIEATSEFVWDIENNCGPRPQGPLYPVPPENATGMPVDSFDEAVECDVIYNATYIQNYQCSALCQMDAEKTVTLRCECQEPVGFLYTVKQCEWEWVDGKQCPEVPKLQQHDWECDPREDDCPFYPTPAEDNFPTTTIATTTYQTETYTTTTTTLEITTGKVSTTPKTITTTTEAKNAVKISTDSDSKKLNFDNSYNAYKYGQNYSPNLALPGYDQFGYQITYQQPYNHRGFYTGFEKRPNIINFNPTMDNNMNEIDVHANSESRASHSPILEEEKNIK